MERFEERSDDESPAPNGKMRDQKNVPRFDVQGHLYRVTGVGLTKASRETLLAVITELAEWSLRHLVISRKISGGARTGKYVETGRRLQVY